MIIIHHSYQVSQKVSLQHSNWHLLIIKITTCVINRLNEQGTAASAVAGKFTPVGEVIIIQFRVNCNNLNKPSIIQVHVFNTMAWEEPNTAAVIAFCHPMCSNCSGFFTIIVKDLALSKPKDHVFFQEPTTRHCVILTSASIGSFFSSSNFIAIATRKKGKELLLDMFGFRSHGHVVAKLVYRDTGLLQ